MEPKASWLSTLDSGSSLEMSSSYFTFNPKNKKTTKLTAMMMYISGLWDLK